MLILKKEEKNCGENFSFKLTVQQAFPKSAILTWRISSDTVSKTGFGVRSAIGRARISKIKFIVIK